MWWAKGGHTAAEVIIKLFTMQTHQCPMVALLLMYCNQYAHYLTPSLCKLSAFYKCVKGTLVSFKKRNSKESANVLMKKSCCLTHVYILAKMLWVGAALAQQIRWKRMTFLQDNITDVSIYECLYVCVCYIYTSIFISLLCIYLSIYRVHIFTHPYFTLVW